MAVLCLRTMAGVWRVGQMVRNARPTTNAGWLSDFEEERVRANHTVKLVVYPEVSAPFATGIFRRFIVIPASGEGWNHERRRAILRHEFAHVVNRDIGWLIFAELLLVFLWPCIPLWWVRRRLILAQEMVADDAVVDGEASAVNYAAFLAEAACQGLSRHAPAFTVRVAESSTLRRRIVRLLDNRKSADQIGIFGKLAITAGCIVSAAALGFGRASVAAQPEALDPRSTEAVLKFHPSVTQAASDTLRLEDAFAVHFPGDATAALSGLRRELVKKGCLLFAELKLSPDKKMLVVEFEPSTHAQIDDFEALLIDEGWFRDPAGLSPSAKRVALPPKERKSMFKGLAEDMERQAQKVEKDRQKMLKLLTLLDASDPDPAGATQLMYANPALSRQISEQKAEAEKAGAMENLLASIPRHESENNADARITEDSSLAEMRKIQSARLTAAKAKLKEMEDRFEEEAVRARPLLHDYADAKCWYREDQHVLESLRIQYANFAKSMQSTPGSSTAHGQSK